MKSLVAFIEKLNKPLIVDEVEIPKLKCGQALIRVIESTICGAQIGEITGAKGEDKYLPHLLGHEGGGIVVDIGEGVKTIKKNDRVVLHWRKGSGIESDPPKYKYGKTYIGGGWVTTFNEYAVISENRLTTIPNDIPFSFVSLLGCGVTTGLGLINNEAKLKMGQSIAVLGVGGVGMNVIQGAKMVSANPIIAIDNNSYKKNIAFKFGADHFILNNNFLEDHEEHIKRLTKGKGVDVFVDCTGIPELINSALQLVASNGKMILVGQPKIYQNLFLQNMRQHYCGKTIFDSQGGLTNPEIDIPRYIKLYQNKMLNIDGMISHTFKLQDINKAIDLVKSGNCLRVRILC